MNPRTLFLEHGRTHWPRVLLVALLGALVLALGVYATTSATAFAPYNPSWDGTSEFRSQLEANSDTETEFITDTAGYDTSDPNQTVAFVIAPDEPYDETDVQRISIFLDRGGTLVVLENFGSSGDQLLFNLGTEARLDGQLLYDERNHQQGPAMPVATNVTDHPITEDVDQLSLNYASAVESGNATVLVSTSDYAYLGDETTDLDDVDDLESYPVATVEDVGSGQVVVVSDPSIVINAMIDEPDNAEFVSGVVVGNERVLVDVSNADDLPPVMSAVLTVRGNPLLQVLLGTLGVGLVLALGSQLGRSVLQRTRPDDSSRTTGSESLEDHRSTPALTHEERVEYLRRRYPEWEDERIDRVTTSFNSPRVGGEQDR